MKAITLLALRSTTGLLLVVWGARKLMNSGLGQRLSEKYYSGLLSAEALQVPFAIGEVILGVLVVLGALRKFTYPLQAIVLGFGAAAIWRHLLDPLSLYLWAEGSKANLLFFPSTTVFAAAMILLAFKEYDTLTVDSMTKR